MSERIGIAPPPPLPSSSSSCLYFLRSQSPTSVGVGCQSSLSSHTRNIRISLTLTLSSKTTTHRIQAGAEGFTKPSPPQSQDDDDGSSSSPPPLDPLVDSPVSIQLQPILSDVQFDTIMAELQQVGGALVIIWMATWCRKCIYLKPKLEKLAAEYYPKIRFYSIDVNAVPHKLVARAGVTKMPTVQVWKDSKKQAEVIGGHKAYLVVNEVREMIENVCSLSL